MINLLHFARSGRQAETGTQPADEPSGRRDAYRDYSDQVVKMVEARGGRVIWTGRPEHVLIGDTERGRLGPGGAGLVPEPGRLHRHGHLAHVRGGPHPS